MFKHFREQQEVIEYLKERTAFCGNGSGPNVSSSPSLKGVASRPPQRG
jgi:hypothetical protein